MTRPAGNHSISPASGYYGTNWPSNSLVIPQGLSVGGWTLQNRGFIQQTFLGASITNFSMNGGFGDSSSTLSVDLVNDEFNKSDYAAQGTGDDPYHNGQYDYFSPPVVGSPVFFKFGKNFATVEEAYRQTFDDTYKINTMPEVDEPTVTEYDKNNFTVLEDGKYVDLENNKIVDLSQILNSPTRGKNHLVFGGILQSYVQNKGPSASPAYSLQVVDPREILSNTTLILNNYTGTTFNNNNILNLYGFLEYNVSEDTINTIKQTNSTESILRKYVDINTTGIVSFSGVDQYQRLTEVAPTYDMIASGFPITGTGFSRRGNQGIPFYRIRDSINTLMELNGKLPEEFKDKGFGGKINFRGFNYVVDLSGLPSLPDLYYFDFDQINLLDLCLEICDITSKALFVTLLPVIDHPACAFVYEYNKFYMNSTVESENKNVIAGIIRIDTIDRSTQPSYGAIKSFIDGLYASGIYVENQDIGFELSNITTDKFIVGSQEVDMYYFSNNKDRDILEVEKQKAGLPNTAENLIGEQWKLETSFKQQILPYYGTLGRNAVTIPKGFGSYQQILLDTTGLNANGVGCYYVATEIELRCAAVSYDRWRDFLLSYSEVYMDSIEENDAVEIYALESTPVSQLGIPVDPAIANKYAVSVPRSVFPSYNKNKERVAADEFGKDGLPISACNPPYGYPLYYKRANKIGIPEAGLTEISARYQTIITNFAALQSPDRNNFQEILNSEWARMQELDNSYIGLTDFEKEYFAKIEKIIEEAKKDPNSQKIANILGLIETDLTNMGGPFKILPKLAKRGVENARRVHSFLKRVADECLGKKFLVQIPKRVNLFYDKTIGLDTKYDTTKVKHYKTGPFGFKPRPINPFGGYEFSTAFSDEVEASRNSRSYTDELVKHKFDIFLDSGITKPTEYVGALNVNFNPIADQYDFNYEPTELGGFFNFDLYQNLIAPKDIADIAKEDYNKLPMGVIQMLIPQDLTNFINDRGRVSPYVRFDNSQFLSLDNLNPESFTQQQINARGMVPDVTDSLDNVQPVDNSFFSFKKAKEKDGEQTIPDTPAVTFVKCLVDDKFYMPPKHIISNLSVYGCSVKDIGKASKPRKIYKEGTCGEFVDSFTYYKANYVPEPNTSGGTVVSVMEFEHSFNEILSSNIINTELDQLDTEHVYALITLSDKVIPNSDSRFKDGPKQQVNTEIVKHILTMDTVKGLEGFEKPSKGNQSPPTNLKDKLKGTTPAETLIIAELIAKKVKDGMSFASFEHLINICAPSPVYPDLVSIPLMSKERCYGPWISSQVDSQAKAYANIGGKVEFIKEENLAPWNYDGYKLMDDAGKLQAIFANSLLLFSERGGFVVPDLASGVSLGRNLMNTGPLVTNITMDVSSAGLKTTYKFDLYTSSFGKLQKQKQDEISKISRERQKFKDEKNALIRKGLGKMQKQFNYVEFQKTLGNTPQQATMPPPISPTMITASVNPISATNWSPSETSSNFGAAAGSSAGGPVTANYSESQVSMQTRKNLINLAENFHDNTEMAKSYYNSASKPISSMYCAYSKLDGHPHMPSTPNTQLVAKQSLYELTSTEDITIFGEDPHG